MNIQVLGQTELRLSRFDLDELNVSLENETERYSAISMFVTSLARCTFVVLDHYAIRMEITAQNITIDLRWDFIENPTRISQINMNIYWPELAEKRIASNCVETIAILHSRTKHAEQQNKSLRRVTEADAGLSVRCVSMILNEIGWSND